MATAIINEVRGAIDADGHILEPPDLWEKYLEPRYRDRAIRLRVGADGLEYFEFDGEPSTLIRPGFAGIMGGMGAEHVRPSSERTYLRSAPFGSMDTKERVARPAIPTMIGCGAEEGIIMVTATAGISGRIARS